ncbi:MAG: helix-turn-helix domain-containing protein [Anaerolineae bacterium]
MTSNGSSPALDKVNLADYVTSEDAAAASGYHANYVRRLLRQGKLKGRKFGNVWFIERESLQDYLQLVEELGGQKYQGTPTIKERAAN